ncbi:MAG: helix-turn-helix transcriptional regulator [Bacillus sp. (in: firmicutes)]
MKIKSNIKILGEKSGYKKAFLAEQVSVSVKQYRNYETGHSYIPIDKAYILAKLFNCRVDDLYEVIDE